MTKINRHHCLGRLLLATALPFGLLAASEMSAHAGTATVTGANGANGGPRQPGGAGGTATATTTTPSDPLNTATATGGNGGAGGNGALPPYYIPLGGGGGHGGPATSTAATKVATGSASAIATSTGGSGAIGGRPDGAGGGGGWASSTATAASPNGSASATATSTGGNGARGGLSNQCCGIGEGGGGGAASATSSATGGGADTVTSGATATGGAGGAGWNHPPGGSASASASARNSVGAALASASAPADSSAKAVANATLTNAPLGAGSAPLLAIKTGQVASDATLSSEGQMIGVGAMSAGYGVSSLAVTYEAKATLDFSTPVGALDLKLLSDNFADNSAGIAFDSMELLVVHGTTQIEKTFSSLTGSAGAETYFTAHPIIGLGANAAGQSIEIEYFLGYKTGTSAGPGDGFGFTYALVDPPPGAAIPEPSTWAMMLVGFAGLAFAGYRARVGCAVAKNVT
jgi:hypothetical protein